VFNPGKFTIGIDDAGPVERDRMWLLSVTSGEMYGGGMKVNPGAKIDDGLLNWAMLHGVPRRALFGLVFLVRSGKHVGKPGVLMGTAARLSVDAPEGFPCHVDGDTVRVTYPVTVRVLAGALPIVVGGTG